MSNIFAGPTDARQSDDVTMAVSRFRPKYRALTPEELALHNAIKEKASELEELFSRVSSGREQSLAMTKLEEAVMWIVKGLTK